MANLPVASLPGGEVTINRLLKLPNSPRGRRPSGLLTLRP